VPALALWFVGLFCIVAVASKSELELKSISEQRRDFEPILPATFASASALLESIKLPEHNVAFIAPDSVELTVQFLTGWHQMHSFYLLMYPYNEEEIWRSYVRYSALTGCPVDETFSMTPYPASPADSVDDNSGWFYGLPPGVKPPPIWLASARRQYLPIVRQAATDELKKPFRYEGPFPLVVIRRPDWPLPNSDRAPDQQVRAGEWEAWVWN